MAFLDDLGVTKLISLIKEKIQNEFAAKDDVVSDVVYEYASDGATKGFFKYKNNKRTVIVNENTLRVDIGVPDAAGAASDKPQMDGTASIGTSNRYARSDHIHPSDTSKADKSSTVTDVSFNSSSSKIQKTINGSTTDVVGVASQSSAGLMSAEDKTKLDNKADKSSTVTNVSFNSSSSKIQKTISGRTTDVVGVASQSSAGLMSASDKTKLDGIDTGSGSNTTYHFTIIDNGGSYYLHCDDSVPVSPGAFVTLHMGDPEYFNAVCMSDPNDSFVQGYFDCRIWNFSGIHVIPIQGDDGNDHYISRIIFARISVDDTGNTVTQSLYVDYDIENNVGDDWADLEANVNW